MNLKVIRKILLFVIIILLFMRLFVKEYQYSDDATVGFVFMRIPSLVQTITDTYYGKPLQDYVVVKFLTDENGVVGGGFFYIMTSFYTITFFLSAYVLILKLNRKEL